MNHFIQEKTKKTKKKSKTKAWLLQHVLYIAKVAKNVL